jgi:small subunit ribosomal protein S19
MTSELEKKLSASNDLLRKIEKLNAEGEKIVLKTKLRSLIIESEMIGLTIAIYNGESYVPVFINEKMVGHRLGEFAPIRTISPYFVNRPRDTHNQRLRDIRRWSPLNDFSEKHDKSTTEIEQKSVTLGVLLYRLKSKNAKIRLDAVKGLGQLGNENAIPALCDILASDPNSDVRSGAAKALGVIGSKETNL